MTCDECRAELDRLTRDYIHACGANCGPSMDHALVTALMLAQELARHAKTEVEFRFALGHALIEMADRQFVTRMDGDESEGTQPSRPEVTQ